jgi:hypothetical protein
MSDYAELRKALTDWQQNDRNSTGRSYEAEMRRIWGSGGYLSAARPATIERLLVERDQLYIDNCDLRRRLSNAQAGFDQPPLRASQSWLDVLRAMFGRDSTVQKS